MTQYKTFKYKISAELRDWLNKKEFDKIEIIKLKEKEIFYKSNTYTLGELIKKKQEMMKKDKSSYQEVCDSCKRIDKDCEQYWYGDFVIVLCKPCYKTGKANGYNLRPFREA